MRAKILILLLALAIYPALGNDAISTPHDRPCAILINGGFGNITSSQEFITSGGGTAHYTTIGAKYVLYAKGNRWEDYAYRMPYYGLGVSHTNLIGHDNTIGSPLSFYLVQGARAINFTHALSLNYEFNLGAACGWAKYDYATNPENNLISSDITVHVGLNLYLRWYISREFNLHAGFAFTHYSNGKWQLPNKGLNNLGGYIETSYNFNRPSPREIKGRRIDVPNFKPYFRHDLHILATATNIECSGEGDRYNKVPFTVLGLNYHILRAQGRMFYYGVGLEAVYDESGGATVRNLTDPTTGKHSVSTSYGALHEQLSLNAAARLEFVQSLYSIFMDFAINVTDPDAENMGFAQTLGIKIYPYKSFFGTFGIKATDFQIAKYLYLGVGYTFNAKK